jgi:hypothetical protein
MIDLPSVLDRRANTGATMAADITVLTSSSGFFHYFF